VRIVGVGCGFGYTVLVGENGRVWSFGHNRAGQLGLGDNNDRNTPQEITALVGVRIVGVGCGGYHTVLVGEDGHVWSFGGEMFGRLGLGDDPTHRNTPQEIIIPADVRIVGVGCGLSHTVLVGEPDHLHKYGRVWSFGNNEVGELGLGDNNPRNTPQEITALAGVRIVGAGCGGSHTVLVGEDGRVWSFGYNEYGQLGLGNQGEGTDRNTPQEITMLAGVRIVGVDCGGSIEGDQGDHTVLVGEDGRIWSFGNNSDGQLGLGDSGIGTNRSRPTEIPDFTLPISIPPSAQAPLAQLFLVEYFYHDYHLNLIDQNHCYQKTKHDHLHQ